MKASREDKLLAALITCKTVREAAKTAGIPERTAFDMLARPEFASRYNELKGDILRGVSGEIRDAMTEAAQIIRQMMNDAEVQPNVRLSAAKTILETGAKLTEAEDILERLTALENKQ